MYSKELLGDRFKEIEAKRIQKILNHPNSHALRVKGAKASHEARKEKLNYGFSKEGLEKIAETMRAYHTKDRKSLKQYSPVYFVMRTFIKSKFNHTCTKCNEKGNSFSIIVHHLDEDKYNNEESNLTTLCRKCHYKVHNTV